MEDFLNSRIEGPLAETFKGYNQFIYTGGVDDLFLIYSPEDGEKLCNIGEAFVEYGKKHKYDFVITIGADLKLVFLNEGQRKLFESKARGNSKPKCSS